MTRYKLTIEYDGSNYAGWQRQENALSVQQVIEDALLKLTQEKVAVHGSGRTDSGVHARGQVAHIDLTKTWDVRNLMLGCNQYIGKNLISILKVEEAKNDFHARFDAKKRIYQYHIINRTSFLTLDKYRAWHVNKPLDIKLMQEAANILIGKHDFSSFRDKLCQAKSPIKTIDRIDITKTDEQIIIEVEAQSFLHHMIRNIVGTLKPIGLGQKPACWMQEILDAKDRTKSGANAPAHGLYFMEVNY